MNHTELAEHLDFLRLTQTEAAQLLGVAARTVRRWIDGEDIPGPAQAALRAWHHLEERHLPWKPDSVSIARDDQEQFKRMIQHDQALSDLLRRVKARGGPDMQWTVDIAKGKATLGPVSVSFYKLQNGGFSSSVYARSDKHPDVERDLSLIEDATFCIAEEFEKLRGRADALRSVADDIRSKAHIFGTSGNSILDGNATAHRQIQIEGLADKILALADQVIAGVPTTFHQFRTIQNELTGLGYSPPETELIAAIADSYVSSSKTVRIMFVKSGDPETPVTKTTPTTANRAKRVVASRTLRYLGTELPQLGSASRLQDYAGPDHVVLDVPENSGIDGTDHAGLYLVDGLHPSEIT